MKTKNQQLYADVQALLKKYKSSADPKSPLLWMSESDYPIYAVRLFALWKHFWNWKEEDNFTSRKRLEGFVRDYNSGKGEKALADLILSQDNIVSFVRPTKNPSEFDLYILVSFGWWYSGIRTKIVDSDAWDGDVS